MYVPPIDLDCQLCSESAHVCSQTETSIVTQSYTTPTDKHTVSKLNSDSRAAFAVYWLYRSSSILHTWTTTSLEPTVNHMEPWNTN